MSMFSAAPLHSRLILIAAASMACGCDSERVQLPAVARVEAFDRPRQPERAVSPMLDVSNGKIRTIFWLLGSLNEYQGRLVRGSADDKVEGFYCNEAEAAGRFRRVLSRLAREQRLHDASEGVFQDCLTEFRSVEIRLALDSFYVDRRTPRGVTEGIGNITLKASHGMFDGMGLDAKLAYLSGAYQRYGREGTFVFANAEHKADLVARLLVEVGATSVRHTTTRDRTPSGNHVQFRASSDLMAVLDRDEP